MGAAHVEIDATTTDIVIECAYFDPPTVFRSCPPAQVVVGGVKAQ